MNTLDRLKRLTGEDKGGTQTRDEKISDLRRRIEQILERRPGQPAPKSAEPRRHPLELMAVVTGHEANNRYGKVFIAPDLVEAGSFYGRRRIREFAALKMEAAALLAGDPRLAQFDCRDALFLDTETTGLAGGTGTLAFLIGVGWYIDEGFVTQRILSRDFSEEPAALLYLSELARQKRFLVTFNGKSFDINLLAARYVMNRMEDPLSTMPHLDLLHVSRRLVGHRLENSRLATIEAQILGLIRTGDIPGSEIPQRYFDWLRHRDARLLADVLEHNRLDVISMALLTAHLAELLVNGNETQDSMPSDVLAAARLHVERGDPKQAERLLLEIRDCIDADARGHARRLLSILYKRAGRWNETVALWEELLAENSDDLFAVEELAKYCEHQMRDYKRAHALVENALTRAERFAPEVCTALRYRLERLRRRLDQGE